MHVTSSVGIACATCAAVLGAGEMVDWALPANMPPVELRSVSYDAGQVVYSRTVHADQIIRAAWHGDMVDVATERGVPECEATGRADYGPQEPETQVFDFDVFFTPDCAGALEDGASYVIWAAVVPVNGDPSEIRSEPFTWVSAP